MKSVKFDLTKNCIYNTYSNVDYDRTMITIRISSIEFSRICEDLHKYKTTEMIVHNTSIHNTRLH